MDGKENLSLRAYLAIGMMLFALFFGAGNLIFPAALGQHAGSNVGWALAGFVLTGVGVPLLWSYLYSGLIFKYWSYVCDTKNGYRCV